MNLMFTPKKNYEILIIYDNYNNSYFEKVNHIFFKINITPYKVL